MRRLGVAAGVAVAVCLAVAVAATWAADVAQRSPIEPPGAWRAAYVAAVVGAALAYLVGLAALARGGLSGRVAVGLGAAIQLVPLAAPLLLSLDVYAYWDYGRLLAEHGLNPYLDVPSAVPSDPAYVLMGADWRDHEAIYGPVFLLLAAGHAVVAGSDPDVAAWLWRALAAASGVALTALAARLGRRAAFSAAFVGWNPLVALHLAGGGHNDGLMLSLVLGGILLARQGRTDLGGALWAPAAAIKPVPLVVLPLVLAAARRRGTVAWRGLAAGAAAVAAVATAVFGLAWLSAAAPVGQLDRVSSVSLPYRLSQLGFSWRYPSLALTLAFGAAYLFLLLQAWRGRPRLGLTLGLLTLSLAWLMPWYALWPLAFAAWEEDRAARGLALVLSLYLLRDAVPL